MPAGLLPASVLAVTLCSQSPVPAHLVHKTIVAATQFAAGQAMTGTAIVLAENALRSLTLSKLFGLTFSVAVAALLLGAGFALSSRERVAMKLGLPADKVHKVPLLQVVSPAPRLDANGDPLPAGAVGRIGSGRFRHTSRVTQLVYAPDGKSLASITDDGYVHFWDSMTGRLRWRHKRPDLSAKPVLVISADSKKVAVLGNYHFTVVASDTGNKLGQQEWQRDNNPLRCLAIAPDLSQVARGFSDATVAPYDTATGQERVRVSVGKKTKNSLGPVAVEFSSNGDGIYAVADGKPGILVFDAKTGTAAPPLEVSNALLGDHFLLSPDRRLLANKVAGKVFLQDLKTGQRRFLIEEKKTACGAFSRDGSLRAIGGDFGTDIILFETATGKAKQRMHAFYRPTLAFAPDGTALASADNDGSVALWDVATGALLSSPEPKHLRTIRFADNGNQILLFATGRVEWWDTKSTKLVRRLGGDPIKYNVQAASQGGKLLAASVVKGDVAIKDAKTGEDLRDLIGTKASHVSVFSPDGTKLFTAGSSKPSVSIWDVGTGRQLHKLQDQPAYVSTLALSPDGRWLAGASLSLETGDRDVRLWDVATGKLAQRLELPGGEYSGAVTMVFAGDSSRLVTAGRSGNVYKSAGDVRLWDVATGKEIRAFNGHANWVGCVALTPDGRMLASGGSDRTLRLWEVASGKERGRIVGHEASVFSLDFSPDGRLLAAASREAPVFIWDAYTLEKPKAAGVRLGKEGSGQLWQNLADLDAIVAFHAVCELIARPHDAVAILETGWKQLPRATPQQMQKWVHDLASDQFTVRKTAAAELERFGAGNPSLLVGAFKKAASLEARQRLEKIVGRLDPERLRRSRMLEVLEQLHTEPARRFLQTLADQKEDADMRGKRQRD